MKKFVVSENERLNILKQYGLLFEQIEEYPLQPGGIPGPDKFQTWNNVTKDWLKNIKYTKENPYRPFRDPYEYAYEFSNSGFKLFTRKQMPKNKFPGLPTKENEWVDITYNTKARESIEKKYGENIIFPKSPYPTTQDNLQNMTQNTKDISNKKLSPLIDKNISNTPYNDYNCVPDIYKPFVYIITTNKKYFSDYFNTSPEFLISLCKITLGILNNETFGLGGGIINKSVKDLGMETLLGLGDVGKKILSMGIYVFNKITNRDMEPSLGHGQFKKSSWESIASSRLGDDAKRLNPTYSAFGTLIYLTQNYKLAIKNGLATTPSRNHLLEKYKTITYIPTTGNHALDMAIIAHNFGQTKALSPWCKTSHELYLTNCKNNTPYQIFKTSNDFENFSKGAFMRSVTDENLKKEPGNVTIFKDKTVLDFLPNLSSSSSSKSHTTISYLTNAIKFYEGLNFIK
jgi:hypothetical protein